MNKLLDVVKWHVKWHDLSQAGQYNKNTTDWVTYKKQKFITHNSRGWEIQDEGTTRFGVWQNPLPSSQCAIFLLCPHVEEGTKEPSEI